MTAAPPRLVPYVTKWTGEHIDDPAQTSLRIVSSVQIPERLAHWHNDTRPQPYDAELRYTDSHPLDRDARGVLWYRDGLARGQGEPMWKTVHTSRQRRSMTKPLCQVCGTKLPDRDIPWLFPATHWQAVNEDTDQATATPPTCEPCWPVAEKLCPHLYGKGSVRAYAGRTEPHGVLGDVYHLDGTSETVVRVRFDQEDLIPLTLGKQLIVALHGLRKATP